MNYFISFCFLLYMANAFSEDGFLGPTRSYTIISDVKDESIPKGFFIVDGTIKMVSSNMPMQNVQVGMLESKESIISDSVGHFTMMFEYGKDSSLYAYKDGWSEVVISNYTFREQHRISLVFYLGQISDSPIKRKPVIYLYSDRDVQANVILDPKGEFTFTYPAYHNRWNVLVNDSAGIRNLDDSKNYPYLFWEAKAPDLFYSVNGNSLPGFIINTDSTIQFLEDKLTQLGLNATEQTDFITFWGPILQKEKFALIQFIIDDQYDSIIAGLDINPKPDAVRRIFILCSPIEDSSTGFDIFPQEFESFERFGFTVVEWGGSEINIYDIKPH